jgi:hypothetical protein
LVLLSWRLPLAALLVRVEIKAISDLHISSVEIGDVLELFDRRSSAADNAVMDRVTAALPSLRDAVANLGRTTAKDEPQPRGEQRDET